MRVFALLAASSLLFLSHAVEARAQDADGCKDHALFTRLPNFRIEDCQSNFNAVDFQNGTNGKTETVEGNVTTLRYVLNAEGGGRKMSPLQIIRNYENAILSKGGKKVYSGGDDVDGGPMGATFSMTNGGKEYLVAVRKMYEGQVTGEVDAFSLYVLEKEAMTQDVEARQMFDAINKNGSVALYINFETGKTIIKPESQGIVDQIVQMLKDNPSLKVGVEGHTDNVGTAAANQTLSESRARAVMNALVAKGIDQARLASRGWGQSKPVADNSSDEGRAKNRRVEIVKM